MYAEEPRSDGGAATMSGGAQPAAAPPVDPGMLRGSPPSPDLGGGRDEASGGERIPQGTGEATASGDDGSQGI